MTPKDDITLCKEPFFSSLRRESGQRPEPVSHAAGGSDLSLACSRSDYSASRIAMACEDVDAQLLGLCVDDRRITPDDELLVELHIDSADATAAARSLERYGYRIVDVRHEGGDTATDSLTERIDSLLTLLNV